MFGFQADPKTLYVYMDTERCGSQMNDCSVAKQSLVALSSGEAEFYGIVRAVATSKQTSQILEHIDMQSEVTIASDSSAARGTCTRTGSGKERHLSIKELWIQESYRKKEFQLVSVDTLLNWADIGTEAHTSERLKSLLRQMPPDVAEHTVPRAPPATGEPPLAHSFHSSPRTSQTGVMDDRSTCGAPCLQLVGKSVHRLRSVCRRCLSVLSPSPGVGAPFDSSFGPLFDVLAV